MVALQRLPGATGHGSEVGRQQGTAGVLLGPAVAPPQSISARSALRHPQTDLPLPPGALCSPAAPPLPRPATFPSQFRTAFSAVAAVLAAAVQRAEQGGASYAHVDLLLPPKDQRRGDQRPGQVEQRQAQPQAPQQYTPAAQQAQQQPAPPQREQQPPASLYPMRGPLLQFEDDGPGLSPQQLRRSLGISSRAHASSAAVPPGMGVGVQRGGNGGDSAASHGIRWTDLQHAALRLGSTALLLTKRQGQGTSAGLLSCAAAAGVGAEGTGAAVDWAADGSRHIAAMPDKGGAAAAAGDSAAAAWQAALDTICCRWPGAASEAWLQQQLASMPVQGTRLLVAQLRSGNGTSSSGGSSGGPAHSDCELDWSSDPTDLRQAAAAEVDSGASQAVPLDSNLPGGLACCLMGDSGRSAYVWETYNAGCRHCTACDNKPGMCKISSPRHPPSHSSFCRAGAAGRGQGPAALHGCAPVPANLHVLALPPLAAWLPPAAAGHRRAAHRPLHLDEVLCC